MYTSKHIEHLTLMTKICGYFSGTTHSVFKDEKLKAKDVIEITKFITVTKTWIKRGLIPRLCSLSLCQSVSRDNYFLAEYMINL